MLSLKFHVFVAVVIIVVEGVVLFRRSWCYYIITIILYRVQCDQIWQKFATWAKLKKVFGSLFEGESLAKKLNLLWQTFLTLGKIFIVVNGHIMKK